MRPLVSILIPAYNAGEWIAETIQSAISQTWKHKEIIILDDGSTDNTVKIAQRFVSNAVTLISTPNRGAPAARNRALQISKGDYIQWLDADDLLVPDKIERQLNALEQSSHQRLLLSSTWAPFYYRTRNARFVHNSLCQNLSPADWLLTKMSKNLHMQTATWLVSRTLTEAAGPWDTRLHINQDGEYFARVLLASEGTLFVPGTGVFYRITGTHRVSFVGRSDKKRDSLFLAIKLHLQYLKSLEESERAKTACLTYMQDWFENFYPERPDIIAELQSLAVSLGGYLKPPNLRWKYAWMRPVFGWKIAKLAQRTCPEIKASCLRQWDKNIYRIARTNPQPTRFDHSGTAAEIVR